MPDFDHHRDGYRGLARQAQALVHQLPFGLKPEGQFLIHEELHKIDKRQPGLTV